MLNFPSSTPHSGTIEKVRAVRQEEKKIKQIKKRRKKKKKLPSNNNGIMIPTDSFVHHYHHSNPNPIGTYIRREVVLDTFECAKVDDVWKLKKYCTLEHTGTFYSYPQHIVPYHPHLHHHHHNHETMMTAATSNFPFKTLDDITEAYNAATILHAILYNNEKGTQSFI